MTTKISAEKKMDKYVLRLEHEEECVFLSKLYLVVEDREVLISETPVFALTSPEKEIEYQWKRIEESMIPAPHNLLMDWALDLAHVRANGTEEDKDNVIESIALQIRTFVQGNL